MPTKAKKKADPKKKVTLKVTRRKAAKKPDDHESEAAETVEPPFQIGESVTLEGKVVAVSDDGKSATVEVASDDGTDTLNVEANVDLVHKHEKSLKEVLPAQAAVHDQTTGKRTAAQQMADNAKASR